MFGSTESLYFFGGALWILMVISAAAFVYRFWTEAGRTDVASRGADRIDAIEEHERAA